MNKISLYPTGLVLSLLIVFALTSCGSSSDSKSDSPTSNGGGGGSVITEQGNFRVIFVTYTEVNGSGAESGTGTGLPHLDALCEAEKSVHGLGGTFKALVGSTNRNPLGSDWVLRDGKEYRREDLTTVIATAVYGLGVGVTLPSPYDNTITTSDKFPWTGLKDDFTVDSNCADWVDPSAGASGTYGKSSIKDELVDLGWTQYWGGPLFYNSDSNTMTCDSKHPIYCVQTKQLPPPGVKKKMFLSSAIAGTAGFAAFDSTCASNAVSKGLSGTYKAVVAYTTPNTSGSPTPVRRVCTTGACTGATGTEQALDWPLLPDTQYILDDGVTYVGKTNVHAFFEGELEEPIGTGQYWSGMGNAQVIGGAHQHCNGWSDAAMNGYVNDASTQTADYGSALVACTTAKPVLCAEQ